MGLYITFPFAIIIEVVFPVLLAFWVIRRYHTSWRLVGIGAIIYLASQLIHIPLLDGIGWLYSNNVLVVPTGIQLILTTAIVDGLATGLCEETARLVGFRLLNKPAQNNAGAFSLGAGHAATESIIMAGLPMLGTFVTMVLFKSVNPNDPALTPDIKQQITSMWAMAWYIPLGSALERLVAITSQLALTFMVLQVFLRKNYWWFVAAILWQAFIDGLLIVLSASNWSEGSLLVVEVLMGLTSAAILWYLLHQTVGPSEEVIPEKIAV